MKFHKSSFLVTMELFYAYFSFCLYGNRVHHDNKNGGISKNAERKDT